LKFYKYPKFQVIRNHKILSRVILTKDGPIQGFVPEKDDSNLNFLKIYKGDRTFEDWPGGRSSQLRTEIEVNRAGVGKKRQKL